MKKLQSTQDVILVMAGMIYFVLVLALLINEIFISGLRATNQVLLLTALLLVPLSILGISRFVDSLTLKVSGQEISLKLRDRLLIEVSEVSSQVSTAEQALWPMLAGHDPHATTRLKENPARLIIGSKEDVSQVFFAHLLAECSQLAKRRVNPILRVPNGGSLKNFADLTHGWIDVYMDFTGTCCGYFNIEQHDKTDATILEELNFHGSRLGIRFMPMLEASEDYCLAAHPDAAAKHQLKKISDLSNKAGELVFAADAEFLNRKDCFLGLEEKYDLQFAKQHTVSVVDRYEFLEDGRADIFVAYETDPELRTGRVVRLQDEDHFFPRYRATPAVREEALNEIEGLAQALSTLDGKITSQQLGQVVDHLNRHNRSSIIASAKAKEFVQSKST